MPKKARNAGELLLPSCTSLIQMADEQEEHRGKRLRSGSPAASPTAVGNAHLVEPVGQKARTSSGSDLPASSCNTPPYDGSQNSPACTANTESGKEISNPMTGSLIPCTEESTCIHCGDLRTYKYGVVQAPGICSLVLPQLWVREDIRWPHKCTEYMRRANRRILTTALAKVVSLDLRDNAMLERIDLPAGNTSTNGSTNEGEASENQILGKVLLIVQAAFDKLEELHVPIEEIHQSATFKDKHEKVNHQICRVARTKPWFLEDCFLERLHPAHLAMLQEAGIIIREPYQVGKDKGKPAGKSYRKAAEKSHAGVDHICKSLDRMVMRQAPLRAQL